MLVSKMQTYLYDILHLKKVITKTAIFGVSPKLACFFVITFFRCNFVTNVSLYF
jgi:hypothetical protein